MRILHTSDWHLGRSFHRVGLIGAQAAYVDHLLEVVESEQVDLVVVAGDIYDRALPPVDAIELANDAFSRLAASRARVVITSGNHDSAHRLGFGSDLIDAAGVHLRTQASRVGTPVLIDDEHGVVAVHGLPYLDPDLLREPWGLPQRSHEVVLTEAMRRVRADLAGRPGVRSVVLAHAFVAGVAPVEPSESERDISVGGVSIVPTSVFDGIDYVALGHLHGRHTLVDRVRYSGSPLAYSFSEATHTKGSWLIDLGADGISSSEFVPAPVPRHLARISGTLDDLLTSSRFTEHEGAWVQATVLDDVRPARAMERLRERFPHALQLGFGVRDALGATAPAAIPGQGRRDIDIALDFVREVRGTEATTAEASLLLDACDSCSADPDLDRVVG